MLRCLFVDQQSHEELPVISLLLLRAMIVSRQREGHSLINGHEDTNVSCEALFS